MNGAEGFIALRLQGPTRHPNRVGRLRRRRPPPSLRRADPGASSTRRDGRLSQCWRGLRGSCRAILRAPPASACGTGDAAAAGLSRAAPAAASRLSAARRWRRPSGRSGIVTSAPSRSRSAPSVTTVSPGIEALDDRDAVVLLRTERDGAHRHRMIGLDHEDEGAARRRAGSAAAGTTTWCCSVLTSRRILTNWLGNSASSALSNMRAQLDRAGGGIDLACRPRRACRVASFGRLAAVVGVDCKHGARLHARHDVGDIVFGHGEQHRHGLKLGDDDDARGLPGADEIADIDLAHADASRHRRGDAGIAEIDGGGFDIGLVGLTTPASCLTSAAWVASACCEVALRGVERLMALEIEPGVGEIGARRAPAGPWPGRAPPERVRGSISARRSPAFTIWPS